MLNHQENIVQNMSNIVKSSGQTNNEISALIAKLSNSETRKTVQESAKIADTILEQTKATENETATINNNIYQLKQKLEDLEPEWDSKLGLAEENVAKSLINIRESNNTWHINEPTLRKQNENFNAWNETFSLKLQELRDKIAKAKHAAEGVSTNFIK